MHPLAGQYEKRIEELLENGNRLIQEARDERSAHERTKQELDVWRERALTFQASLRRVQPIASRFFPPEAFAFVLGFLLLLAGAIAAAKCQ